MEYRGIKRYTYAHLSKFTNDFSEENYLGEFQFGEVYHGEIKEEGSKRVLIKIWELPEVYHYDAGDNLLRLTDEILLLRHPKLASHPGMIKLCGYCRDYDEHFAAVYDFEPLDIVSNLVLSDTFTWLQRIKVAFGFACLVKFLHTGNPRWKPFIIRNISAAHIAVDKEFNAKLFDFSMISGGIFPDRASIAKCYPAPGCIGYIDICVARSRKWTYRTDVFAFGVLLLNLISRRIYDEEGADEPCKTASGIKPGKRILVHESLLTDPDYCVGDGRKITKLAMRCISRDPVNRPTMKKVVELLLKLQVVNHHAEYIGVKRLGVKRLGDTNLSTN